MFTIYLYLLFFGCAARAVGARSPSRVRILIGPLDLQVLCWCACCRLLMDVIVLSSDSESDGSPPRLAGGGGGGGAAAAAGGGGSATAEWGCREVSNSSFFS